jgi:hypothetical protein
LVTIQAAGGEGGTMRGGRYLVVLAGVGVLVAGCGTKVAPAGGLAAAVTRTAGQSARIAVTTTTQMQGMSVSFTETGVFDFARSRGMVSMRNPVGITEIFIPPKTYIKIPGGVKGPLPHGKAWIAVDTGTSVGPESSLLDPFGGGTDPADLLASLTAISSSVTKLGTTTIRGVRVTGFRVDIDPAKAAARVPRWERAGFLGFTASLGPGTIPVDVWVDGQNLVRRVQLSLHLPGGAGASAGASLVQATDFYDFGVPVRVSAPPAAQIASIPQFITGGSPGSAGTGGSPRPPRVSGTLSPAQAAAAGQAVGAFWSALGRNDPAAVAQTVRPDERSCVRSLLSNGGPKITVTSFRIVSAQPAGNGRATVRFTVRARASLDGQNVPVLAQGPGHVQWLLTTETAGHWHVDLARSSTLVFSQACP